ncbi:MspA family porin [Gordonia sp. TBRC 11910]|uniref:MspA family porin n=1 Tax=Gordonia asplenii TaxID=2725283 RepID=A0A848KQP6_9ACTN|nr:MspA family porin [Gordonia asplenii]NMO00379.1 MspA family porin [Gordonia asplenii]
MRTEWVPAITAVLVAASTLGTGIAQARTDPFADRAVTKVTDDGWRVTATKSRESLRDVAPLDGSQFSHEAFVALTGRMVVTGHGSSPITSGSITAGLQVGCNVDISSGLSLGLSAGPYADVTASIPPTVDVGVSVTPNVGTTLKPGTIVDLPFGTKKFTATPKASISFDGVHVKSDGCYGPTSIRTFVTVSVSSKTNDSTFSVYGDPHRL